MKSTVPYSNAYHFLPVRPTTIFKTRSFTSVFIFLPSWYVLFPIGTCYWCQFRSGVPVNVYRKSSPIILQWTDGSQQIHTFLAGPRQLEHWPWLGLPAAANRPSVSLWGSTISRCSRTAVSQHTECRSRQSFVHRTYDSMLLWWFWRSYVLLSLVACWRLSLSFATRFFLLQFTSETLCVLCSRTF